MTIVERDGQEGAARRLARLVLAACYAVAGIGHLIATRAMVAITPAWVPDPYAVVVATGVCELAGAVALLTRRFRRAAGWALAFYAVCVFPANIQHALHDLGGHVGLGWGYHAPRLFLQPLIAWWALWASGAVGAKTARP